MKAERFGRYLLIDRIGAGGMAEVFLAVLPGAGGFKRTFVVKKILAERAQSSEFVKMFVEEARIGSLLYHPNIVEVYDFGNVDGMYFLAMEYLNGRDLATVIRRLHARQQVCPPALAAFIAHEVALGLGYAHSLTEVDGKSMNIVHRDVTPSNIMCLRTGGVKLLDFGIAKAFTDDALDESRLGVIKGKASYLSPEQLLGESCDGRVDLFSLGIVLWELLVGRRLFRAKSAAETMRCVLDLPVPVPSSLRPEIPPALDAVVLRALERDPAARYPTGQAMADDLEEVLRLTPYPSKALQALVSDLFGTEMVSARRIASGLEDAKAGGEQMEQMEKDQPKGVGQQAMPEARPRHAVGRGGKLGKLRTISAMSVVAATVALGALLFVRTGGRNPRAILPLTVPARAVAGPLIVPISNSQPERPNNRLPPDGRAGDDSRLPARATRGGASTDEGRITRGLSIDPFAKPIATGGTP